MVRSNDKVHIVDFENSIKKSNELSISKLNNGLTLTQVQLLAYAIFRTQQDGKTEFKKAEFERKFELDKYLTSRAKEDAGKLSRLQVSSEDLSNDSFSFWNVFLGMQYERGTFSFTWSPMFLPHILDLKEKYVTNDLRITSKFRSSYTWTLYDYLKAHYGYWHKKVAKEELLKLFNVEDVKTYNNAAQFKRGVLDVAIKEINEHTELEASYKEIRSGRKITAFDFNWSIARKQETAASEKQLSEITAIVAIVEEDMWNYLDPVADDAEANLRMMKTIKAVLAYKKTIVDLKTRKQADEALRLLTSYLRSLERQLREIQFQKDLESNPYYQPLYNWLEERD